MLEGSALGARILVKRAASLGFSDAFGARHLCAQTADPTAWSRFVELLDRWVMTSTEEDECIAGAKAVFACFERELNVAAALS